jgi:hypothetical protein
MGNLSIHRIAEGARDKPADRRQQSPPAAKMRQDGEDGVRPAGNLSRLAGARLIPHDRVEPDQLRVCPGERGAKGSVQRGEAERALSRGAFVAQDELHTPGAQAALPVIQQDG